MKLKNPPWNRVLNFVLNWWRWCTALHCISLYIGQFVLQLEFMQNTVFDEITQYYPRSSTSGIKFQFVYINSIFVNYLKRPNLVRSDIHRSKWASHLNVRFLRILFICLIWTDNHYRPFPDAVYTHRLFNGFVICIRNCDGCIRIKCNSQWQSAQADHTADQSGERPNSVDKLLCNEFEMRNGVRFCFWA